MFLDACQSLAGNVFRYAPYWDLISVIKVFPALPTSTPDGSLLACGTWTRS
jgi:hypothetical protein